MGFPLYFHLYSLFLEKSHIVKKLLLLLVALPLFACTSKEEVDLIVHNANIYTVDGVLPKATSVAVRDGRFLEVGEGGPIMEKYSATTVLDAKGKTMVPGLIDAHCHFYGLGMTQQVVDLVGTLSFDAI